MTSSAGADSARLARVVDDSPIDDPNRVIYAYYLRGTRAPVRGVRLDGWISFLSLLPFVCLLLLEPGVLSAGVVLGAAGVLGALRIALTHPAREVGVALTDTHVIVGRFGIDTRVLERAQIASCTLSDRAWAGGELPPAAASWPIRQLRYLTITCEDSVAYNVAFDDGNPYAEHIHDVLRGATPLLSPPALAERHAERAADAERRASELNRRRSQEARAANDARGSGRSTVPSDAGGADNTGGAAEQADVERRLWAAALERHDAVLLGYLPYETEPQLLLTYPAMSDVSVPETADFVNALAEAAALRTDEFPDSMAVSAAYRGAVRSLEAAWSRAERGARRAGTSLLDGPDRRRIEQASKLLAHADSATTPHERESYLRQVKSIVDHLVGTGAITAPVRVMSQIAAATARAIEEAAD